VSRPRRRPRARFWLVAAFGLFVFLGIAALLARMLTGAGNERAAVLAVVQAQARGNAGAVLGELPACRAVPACAEQTRALVGRLRRPGAVEILAYRPSTQLAITTHMGIGRVAWRAGTGLPVVQCVRARRNGPLARDQVELLSISPPIRRTASCS
jgi:hypothetical protein